MKKIIFYSLVLSFFMLATSCQNDNYTEELAQKIMNIIDSSAKSTVDVSTANVSIDSLVDYDREIIIDIMELTDFEWDKMIAISAICSDSEISEILGFKHAFPKGYRDKLVFLKDNEVVYKETYAVSVEEAVKFSLYFNSDYAHYRIFSPQDAKIIGVRFQSQQGNVEKFTWCYSLLI